MEIQFGLDISQIYGYLIVDQQLKRLPIGSTVDTRTGTFYWSPGPGFIGTYELVFIIQTEDGAYFKKMVGICIEPKFIK